MSRLVEGIGLTVAVGLVATAWFNAAHAPKLLAGEPPSELQALANCSFTVKPLDAGPDRYVKMQISFDTMQKRVFVHWTAKSQAAAAPLMRYTSYNTAYYPTAMDHSFDNSNVFYIAGSNSLGRVLQKWTVGSIGTLAASGTPLQTTFTPPSIDRDALPIDSSIQSISCLTVNKWPPGGGSEEVWVLEWETRTVYAIDRTTGVKQLRVGPTLALPYRSIDMKRHSIFGAVCFFRRRPFFLSEPAWAGSGAVDPDMLVTYDQNLDGVIDGNWTITWAQQSIHPLYVSGTWLAD